ncbi:hypothetical protein [Nocardioides sp.]|uniref:hypothetical protein n=1 Tax=Nocardioides sp. TaxID=35761 RepID=UPI00286A8056|nr:hypothetical protein [Nocardioides sp.]
MLNDLARQTRIMLFCQVLGPAVMFGSVLAVEGEHWGVAVSLFVLGLVLTIAWGIGVVVWNRRADRRFRSLLEQGAADLVAGRVTGVPAAGRVVRRRLARHSPSYLVGTAGPLDGPSAVLAITVLAPGGARRVGALVPAMLALESRKAPVAVLLHPDEPEVAVLDPRITPQQLAAIGDDPRWRTEWLPTDSSVVGGWLPALACGVLGIVVGVGLDWLVVSLAT